MTLTDRRVPKKGRVRQREQERQPIDPSALIVTRRLSKRYDSLVAVDHLDIEVRAGEIFGLLGQNGAGKTTTILMLLGLTEPSSGGARVAGYDPARNPLEVKRRVGYLPDAVGFYDGMTGRENLRYTAKLNGLRGAEAEARITEAIEQVGMTDRADTKVETYSRGMKQRLGIADALVKDPSILILDEPTTAIDPIGVIEILDMLRRLVHERGLAILLSSHLLAQVQSVCDRIGIFAAGKLIGVGTVSELAEANGFATNSIELLIDAPPAQDPDIAAAISSVAGVVSADTRFVAPVADAPAEATGSTPVVTGERVWIVAIDPDRQIPAMISSIVQALAKYRVIRIGRHEPSLDEIYRRAVSNRGAVA